jgi:addiction module RelB/DinJ family antitoxin
MKVKDTYVRARVDNRLKRDSEKILNRLGLTTAEAIRLFLEQIRLRKGLPFPVVLLEPTSDNNDLLLPVSKRQAALDSVYED